MSDPRITLHDVTVEGDATDGDAVLAAVERAVAQATGRGTTSSADVRDAVTRSVARDGPR